ncbi:phosphonoacetate hydrolase [Paraburkholderia sp. Ac-20342]|uniref:phosphonoacetate hydrolase n=1 Tax=unclassified Paraburkholderia TaxID=2615204 RepID=UPI00141D836D|nr:MULTISPECIES: phosphonoacetate hydrolase [unclassified Paraburkholderia]MBN3845987.1 phosphonoacetate hydrolase [Paraburkholderia sp. Ac-20342]NIF77761.1 phosphonoacetate hydrolase [Paraburkholderia sp. Cy-641]
MTNAVRTLEVNGRRYALPRQPTVVACVDGLDRTYLDAAFERGIAPFLQSLHARGWCRAARCAMPSYTNPNNLSIVTGVAPSVHGIAGNYFYDEAAGAEVMMNDPAFLRAPTILAELAGAGARVAVVTAKDKLRRMLGHGLPESPGALCFSVETAGPAAAGFLPSPLPPIYSAAASEAVFSAGVLLLQRWKPDFLYLSTTDYIQHKYAPGETEANQFLAMLDRHLAAMHELGARLVLTADHGMGAKSDAAGQPNVLFLADRLDAALPTLKARVVLPITDPYVRHHGALGGFATVYLHHDGDGANAADIAAARTLLAGLPGIDAVLDREEAAASLELPADRIGDLVVLAGPAHVLGTRVAEHDLSGLDRPLRSHGSLHEQPVPLISSFEPADEFTGRALRNFDAFAVALAGEHGN